MFTTKLIKTLKFHLTEGEEGKQLLVDIVMLTLLSVNLVLIFFNGFFSNEWVQDILQEYLPSFYYLYHDNIYENFNLIDGIFVVIYLSEFFISWIIAVRKKTYDKWFFYPVLHFYDLLGSLPFDSFRWLRLLRFLAILYRWHNLGIINLYKSDIVRTVVHYYNIIMEEITDRVVVNILQGIKAEIQSGNNVTDQIINDVIKPHKTEIIQWASEKVSIATEKAYNEYKDEAKEYIDDVIKEAVNDNSEIQDINKVPLVGSYITGRLEHAIGEIVFNVIEGLFTDVSTAKNKQMIEEIVDKAVDYILTDEENGKLNDTFVDITSKVIDILIAQVKVQQWKLREKKEKEETGQVITTERYTGDTDDLPSDVTTI
ncbi:hypothetical protein V6R21_31900 [Limibacter armeniacum]|uniref:hypothetical protein n=1 Tax=Limibacter armeniacum TaxID=466084 RepID=UPI002FE55B48